MEPAVAARLEPVATVREPEGISVVISRETAARNGIPAGFEAAWITLEAETDLDLVGLTARVSARLADAGIACNVIAGTRHDHLFVPADRGQETVALLSEAA